MQQETSWMYDPFNVFRIRINGQLILLMLVDRLLELGCKIVQVNTDGVVYIAKKTAKDEIQETVSEVGYLLLSLMLLVVEWSFFLLLVFSDSRNLALIFFRAATNFDSNSFLTFSRS